MSDDRAGLEPESRPPAVSRPGGLAAWMLGLAVAVAAGYLFRTLALPALLGALLAYLLNPLVSWAQGLGVRRSVAVGALFAGIGVVVLGGGLPVVPRFRAETLTLASSLPALAGKLEAAIDGAMAEVATAYPDLARYLPRHTEAGWLERLIQARVGGAEDLVGHAGTIALAVVLVPLFAFFLLRDGGRMVTFLMDRLDPAHIETTVAVWCEIDRIIGRYLRGLALDAIIVGILTTLGLWALGVPFPLHLGIFSALVNPLPYLGPLLAVSAAGIVALAHGQGLGAVGWIIALYLAVRLVDDFVVMAVIIGGSVRLHPMLVVASILAGEEALGLVGMVIAVPLVTVVKESARLLLEHRRNLARPHVPAIGKPASAPHYVC